MEAVLTMRLRPGTETLKRNKKRIEYEVLGLPPGHEAIIKLGNDGWQILRGSDTFPGEWVGDYDTAEAALAALQEALEED
jgi:hypothetical protein